MHTRLLAGSVGRTLNSYGASILMVLCATGSVLWWPGTTNWRSRFRIEWTSGWRKLSGQLHHVTGVTSVLFIALLAFTGTYFFWSAAYVRIVSSIFTRTAEPRVAPGPPGSGLASLGHLEASAAASFPGVPIHRIQVVERPNQAVRVTFRAGRPEEFHLVSTAFLHPVTGEVLGRVPLSERPWGDRILSWFSVLHFGVFGGWPIKVLWAVWGLSLPGLAVSGLLMWWRRVVQPLGWASNPPARL